MKTDYYLDTCIWLNLFKKETGPEKNKPYWKSARNFIEKVEENNEKIIVSSIALKEIYFVARNKFKPIKDFLKESECVKIIKTYPEDYDLARKWEKEDNSLSFYDYIHIAIAKRLNLNLITRDEELIIFAKKHVKVSKPEEV